MANQIFQTDSKSRWKKFKWSLRIVAFIAVLLVAVFVIMVIIDKTPNLPFKEDYRSALMASKPYLKENKYSKAYEGFRYFIKEKKQHNNYSSEMAARLKKVKRYEGSRASVTQQFIDNWSDVDAGLRSAFYVTWDPQSYISLKQNIKKLNLVIPEWYLINPKTLKLESRLDAKGFNLMKKSGVPVMPMLSNSYNGEFIPQGVEKILSDSHRRKDFIAELLKNVQKNKFVGINIDIENLDHRGSQYLTVFVKELSQVFHDKGLFVTQDIAPFSDQYDVKSLAKYDDYLFAMAYDEHMTLSDAGPISSQQWIEAAIDDLAKKVPKEKIVLGIGAYGYDWSPSGENNVSISYNDAMSLASDTESKIIFNDDTYSLNFAYTDDNDQIHQVFFNDAATHFNTMRFGAEYGLAGFSVWRLGTEDERLWQFYHTDMSHDAAAKFRVGDLERLKGSNYANYIGEGEVLDVLYSPHPGNANIIMDNNDILIAEEYYTKIPTSYQIQKFGKAHKKDLLLTFDDGPDERWTPKILDILKKYKVHAAFFMVGLQMEKNLPVVKQVYEDGNLIGNHTFTHRNVARNSPTRTFTELRLTRLLLESITGRSTILFRAPYNADSDPASNEELIPLVLARRQNYLDVGESIDPNDWEVGVKADDIYKRVIKGVEQGTGHIILLHDAGGETRAETVKALPRIIEYLQGKGYRFITLPQYLGKSTGQLMPSVAKGDEYYAMQANLTLATIIYEANNFIAALLILFLILGFGRLSFMFVLTIREKRVERKFTYDKSLFKDAPLVSVIVPAYNEEVNAVSSLKNLLELDYPNFNVIFVDDGSTDETYKRVCDALGDNSRIKILTKPNAGKASALNYGIAHTDADYVVCIDADTKLRHDAVSLLMLHFMQDKEGKVGAVAGNVKVGNCRNILTKWQAIEYTTSQNFDRMAYSNINAITVVPGAIGAFRREAIEKAGGLTTDTLAEDCDLTIRIIMAGFVIENENRAVAMTEAPEKLKQFIKQRTRWCFGVMQTFWKHRNGLMAKKYKGLGLWALPNMLVFQFIIPTFSPIADILMIVGLFSGNVEKILLYYLLFTVIDASVSIMAYIFEKERLWVLLWIIPQRLCYRWIMYFVLFKSYKKAIKGELQTWGVLKRTGNVQDVS